MPIIAAFKAFPFSAFSNPPGGGNDPFVMSNNSAAQLLDVTIDDNDNSIAGDTITNETGNDNNQIATVTYPNGATESDVIYVEWTATYTGSNGQVIQVWRFELNNGLRMFAMSDIPVVGVVYTTNNKNQGANNENPADIPQIPCFTSGTLILTKGGPVPVEKLSKGDLVTTLDHGDRPIQWIGRRRFGRHELEQNPKLFPIRILQGALGDGTPTRDLLVSRQHRMLVRSPICERIFNEREVLIPAIRLTTLPGIYEDKSVDEVEYVHFLLPQHGIVFAEHAPTESLLTGAGAMACLPPDALEEVHTIFPHTRLPGALTHPARMIPSAKQQKTLIARHAKNTKPLLN